MCDNDIQNDQNDVESDDERVALANLKLDVNENKKIQKKLKKANTTLAQELKECKTILAQTSITLGESNSVRDSCLVALQNKQTEFEKYKAFHDRTVDCDKLERKLNETLGQLALKDIEIKEGLKTKAYEISVVKEKHDELIKQSLLTKSHYDGLVKQKTKAQSKIPCLYAFPYDQSTHANRLIPDGEETLALEKESRSKLNKHLVRPYDYTTLNSLYENFKPPTQEFKIQFAHANEIRKKMWRKYFVKYKPNIYKNVGFLPVSKSINKSRQAYNVMTNNINHFKEIVDNAWIKHLKDQFRAPTSKDMEILIQTCLMPLAIKTQNDSFIFVHELKQEMHADLKYVESLEKEIDELESDKAEFLNMYDMILQECVSKDVIQPNIHRIPKPSVLGKSAPFSKSLERRYFSKTESVPKTNVSEGMYRIDNWSTQTRAPQSLQTVRNTNPRVSTSTGVNHKTNVSRPQHKSNQLKDKLVPNNSQVKLKKTQVEVHPRIPSISNKMKSVTACNDSLNSRTSNANAVCATCNKCLVDSNHFTCVTQMLNDVNARTKKPNVVPISTRKPKGNITINQVYYVEGLNHNLFSAGQFCDADLEVAFRKSTCFVRDLQGNDLLTGNRGSDLYTISLQELTSSTPLCLMAKASPTQAWLWHRRLSHLNFDYINLLSKKDIVIGLPKLKYVKDQLCSSCELSKAKKAHSSQRLFQVRKEGYVCFTWTYVVQCGLLA
nr:integrase, catalytic region, zinc finger, CCHC-type, peptidase aspartic, catalytic [Tanacetum cinerariifolium]